MFFYSGTEETVMIIFVWSCVQEWSVTPMFERKDNKKASLLDLNGRPAALNKKYTDLKNSGEKLHKLTEVKKGTK